MTLFGDPPGDAEPEPLKGLRYMGDLVLFGRVLRAFCIGNMPTSSQNVIQ